jgi:hypothetical protein
MVNPVTPGPAPGTVHQAPKPATGAPAQATPAQAAPAAQTDGAGAEGEKPKKKRAAKAKTGVSRPRLARPDENHVITLLRPKAKTGKSGERFDQIFTGMTVKQYVDLMTSEPWNRTVGQAYHTLRWDTDPNRKLINIGPTTIDVPPPPPKPEPKAKAEKTEKQASGQPAA